MSETVTSPPGMPGSSDPFTVQGGNYAVDPFHTHVGFNMSHFGISYYRGFFHGASGSLVLDPAQPAKSKVDVSIAISSVLTTFPALNEELQGAAWFDSAQFPTATFTSTRIVPLGADHATIEGELTLHGVTKPVSLDAHFVGAGNNPINKIYTVGFQATATINRSEFGMGAYVPVLGDEIKLLIDCAFERQT